MSFPRYPKYKKSGVEWLGNVPEGWELLPLRWYGRCSSGESISSEEVSLVSSETQTNPVIGGNGLMGYCDKFNVNNPVLVVGRVGALCGNVHYVQGPAWITDNALILIVNQSVFYHGYLVELLRTRNLNDIASKTAQPLITGTQLRDQRLPCPKLSEQQSIANLLDRDTARIDALIEKVQSAIDKLKEYRTALISAAVTGKIDVRKEVKDAL
ncbi:MAG: hypothetical protein COS89_05835 [Deltaproteobacteria bacterium CG07_land_8_20_14_0_80_38_7]|nr:MAG: hypothetical protein COS89_05835 [Deltaproteobacteria bacterium CG07_land_8_20_14_0_80_38_7]